MSGRARNGWSWRWFAHETSSSSSTFTSFHAHPTSVKKLPMLLPHMHRVRKLLFPHMSVVYLPLLSHIQPEAFLVLDELRLWVNTPEGTDTRRIRAVRPIAHPLSDTTRPPSPKRGGALDCCDYVEAPASRPPLGFPGWAAPIVRTVHGCHRGMRRTRGASTGCIISFPGSLPLPHTIPRVRSVYRNCGSSCSATPRTSYRTSSPTSAYRSVSRGSSTANCEGGSSPCFPGIPPTFLLCLRSRKSGGSLSLGYTVRLFVMH
ncbi:hypothetical protein K466DRAFT_262984 [Polyporus arcularius HHB13444]|uniref:Uncharacterized protein n=1 Tax=Polyporus arcularius HHB13444 TaxID=1314778 RepID=A0A5C3P494_9APHY|nr:hypothetical protein K466DRAFT_262984 [Polyporus arcularius HHB13444]